jgi:[protein-PII] uridylyltransferase
MSSLAFKQDIHHDNTVLKFIAKLKTKLKIDMLYILTYADINGVSKSTYSEYNSSLINQLYVNTLELLNRKELITETQKRTRKENSIKKQESFQKLIKIKQKKILNIESNLFFIKHNVLDILQISDIAFDIQNFKYTIQNETFLSIEIYRTIPLNLGYLLSKLSFLNVKEMEIFTLFNNVKYFKINFSDTLNEMELERVKEILEYSFDMNKKFRLSTPSIQQEDICIDCLHSKSYYQFR